MAVPRLLRCCPQGRVHGGIQRRACSSARGAHEPLRLDSFPAAMALGGAASGGCAALWLLRQRRSAEAAGDSAMSGVRWAAVTVSGAGWGGFGQWLAATAPKRCDALEAQLRLAQARGAARHYVMACARAGAGCGWAVSAGALKLAVAHSFTATLGTVLATSGPHLALPVALAAAFVSAPAVISNVVFLAPLVLAFPIAGGLAAGAFSGWRLARAATLPHGVGIEAIAAGLRGGLGWGPSLRAVLRLSPLATLCASYAGYLSWGGMPEAVGANVGQSGRDDITWARTSKFSEAPSARPSQGG